MFISMICSLVLMCACMHVCCCVAHTEVVTDDEDGLQHMGVAGPIGVDHKKRRGLRRLFGR